MTYIKTDISHKFTQTFLKTRSTGSYHDTVQKFVPMTKNTTTEEICIQSIPGLPWGWHFNPHTHPIPTGIPIGIPMGIPIPTEPEVSTLLHVGLPSPYADSCCLLGRYLVSVFLA